MGSLTGKVAIVTGASSGIGQSTARLFASEGARVVLGSRRQDKLDEVVAEIRKAGGSATAVAGDVQDEAFSESLVNTARDRFGRLDIAFNNAGAIGAMGPTTDLSRRDWQRTLDTNLTGAFLAAKHQIPAMCSQDGGSVVFTSSFVGHTVAFPELAAYGASKAGLIGLTKALAVEFARDGIRVNALLPGATDTDMAHEFAGTPEARELVAGLYPMRRFASPDEIARSALYLASEASSFTTGSALLVDGGVSIHRT